MNVHSHSGESVTFLQAERPLDDEAPFERRTRILDAAERCFVRAGFHRTTIQDIAAEARMSAGNLYRYFVSKDAMVAGLAERDRAQLAEDFTALLSMDDFAEGFARLGRKHLAERPRAKAILCLEIWAEATRNPVFATLTEDFERDVTGRMATLFQEAQAKQLIAPAVDPDALAVMVSTLADGLFVRRAILPGFCPEREVAAAMAVIEAAFQGRIQLPNAADGARGEVEKR
jgi:TetR/AcrR family transcriptional repressor of uid operon